MSVKANIPQVSALKAAVEKVAGYPIKTHNEFVELVGMIESSLSEHMSESTLERAWGYSTRNSDALSLRTLDVLARFAGYAEWEDFCRRLKEASPNESEELLGECIHSSSLNEGDTLLVGWMPDRLMKIIYLGDHRFRVMEAANSSLRPGDSFECLTFQKKRELYLDHFVREGSENASRYVVGQKAGLTTLELL